MAFDGHQTTLGNSLFQTSQRQSGDNVMDNSGCMPVPFIPNPVASRLEHMDVSWSQNDQYELGFDKSAIKNRKPTDANCDGEADLQGLVSNILGEADSQDCVYSESLPTYHLIWSPKTLEEELSPYFPPEPEPFSNPSFISNHLPHETFGKAQQPGDKEVNDLCQLFSGLASNQQWSLTSPNGGTCSVRPQKLPPGLPLPSKVTADLSQMQQYEHVGMPPYDLRGNDAPLKNLPAHSDVFRPPNEARQLHLDDLREDAYSQKSGNPFFNESGAPEDVNQLVSSFQSFMPADRDGGCFGDFSSTRRPATDTLREGPAQPRRKFSDPAKELFGHLDPTRNGRIGEARKQNFKLDDFQDLPEFTSEHMEYLQKPKALSAHLSFPNQRLSKTMTHAENHNLSVNQFSKAYPRQSQKKIKPQMEKENKMAQMPAFAEEGFARRQQTNTRMPERDKQPFSQNPYLDFQGNVQSPRRDGENIMISAGNVQQFTPLPYSLNDLMRYSSMALNSNLSPRYILPCEKRGPRGDVNGTGPAKDAAAFNPFISDPKSHRGESTYHGMASAVTASPMMNQGSAAFHFHFYLDECYEQCRSLEKERKKMEVLLKKAFPGRRTPVTSNNKPPKTPPRPTRVDYLIVNQMKEQAKVPSLFDRMEYLCGVPLHVNIQAALKRHHMAVCVAQTRCKDSGNVTKQLQQGTDFIEDRDNLLMVMALKDLAATTKRLRTALWCALQITLPIPIKTQDNDMYEPTCPERDYAPLLGASII
ncbi:uncharacterized protein moto [Fundulus heteroclitus]|uniref:uncharacterized protein moto n=1 Tax=Fundulus heteroclitus TaxID=8078 RepID=UPI00165C8366|nr:uncharacterized protein moto [Fundulus heteroclitus]